MKIMLKTLIIVFFLISLIFTPLSTNAGAPDAFFNPDFEYWTNGNPDNWEIYDLDDTTLVNESIPSSYVHNGTYSAKITVGAGGTDHNQISGGAPGVNGQTHTFTAWVYDNDPNVKVRIRLYPTTPEGVYSDNSTDIGWQQLHVTHTVDSDSISLFIIFHNENSTGGVVYVDECEFYQGTFNELNQLLIPAILLSSFTVTLIIFMFKKKKRKV